MSRFHKVVPTFEFFGLFNFNDPMYRVVLPNKTTSKYVYSDKNNAFIMALLTFDEAKALKLQDVRDMYMNCTIEEHARSKCSKVDNSNQYLLPTSASLIKILNGPLNPTFNGNLYDTYIRTLADHCICTKGADAINKLINNSKALKASLADTSLLKGYVPFTRVPYYLEESYSISFVVHKYCDMMKGDTKKCVQALIKDVEKIISIIEKSAPSKSISAWAEFDEYSKGSDIPSGVVNIQYAYNTSTLHGQKIFYV